MKTSIFYDDKPKQLSPVLALFRCEFISVQDNDVYNQLEIISSSSSEGTMRDSIQLESCGHSSRRITCRVRSLSIGFSGSKRRERNLLHQERNEVTYLLRPSLSPDEETVFPEHSNEICSKTHIEDVEEEEVDRQYLRRDRLMIVVGVSEGRSEAKRDRCSSTARKDRFPYRIDHMWESRGDFLIQTFLHDRLGELLIETTGGNRTGQIL